MASKSYTAHVTMLLGSTFALLLLAFIFVAHHLNVPHRVQHGREMLLSTPSSVAERIKPVAQVAVGSMEAQKQPEPAAAPPATEGAATPVRDGQQVYQATCVACHGAGVAGAPKVGDKGQWAAHIAKGTDTLYASAINGLTGTAMPAKGGNAALTDAEVKAAVDYMIAQSK